MATQTNDQDRRNNPDINIREPTDAHRDPITGAPGAHPAGTAVGAVAGGAGLGVAGAALAGAASGAAFTGPAAPIGAAIGAVVGAVAGGLAGKGMAENINPTAEDAYWRENYKTRPYVESGRSYDDYRPAYQYGWESRSQHAGKSFDDAESHLRSGWERFKDRGEMAWDKAKHATRDAWDHVSHHHADRAAGATTSDFAGPTSSDQASAFAASANVGGGSSTSSVSTSGFDDAYWRQNYSLRPYFRSDYTYDDDFAPAYRFGSESRRRFQGHTFDESESELRSGWEKAKGKSRLTWESAKAAVRDAWDRITGDDAFARDNADRAMFNNRSDYRAT